MLHVLAGKEDDATRYNLGIKRAEEIGLDDKFWKELLAVGMDISIQAAVEAETSHSLMVEAYRKRRYKAHFISKLSDSDMENSETKGWLKFAYECKYLTLEQYSKFVEQSDGLQLLLS
ncbi:MAG: four helix bundle protein [Sphingobacteriales bacterium]|nr:MAG: four helix bundle protein [Sphingobacteriales bacterium]